MTNDLEKVGFSVTLNVVDIAGLNQASAGSNPPNMFYSGWGNVSRDPDFAVALPYTSPGLVVPVHNPTFDRLILAGQTTPNGPARAAIYAQLQQQLWSQLPTLPIIFSDDTSGLTSNVHGYQIYPTFIDSFDSASLG